MLDLIMDPENRDDLLNIKRIEDKIFKYKSMYHPNLIANLSKDAHDLYLIRISICNNLLTLIDKNKANFKEVKEYIKNQSEETKNKLKNTKERQEKNYLKLVIEEWQQFLT